MQAYWLDCIHLLVFRRTIWQYLLKLKSHSVWHSKLFTPKMYPVDTLMEVFICTYILKRISCLYAGSLQSCPTLCDLWTVAQAPLSLGLSRQEYRSALPSSRGIFPTRGPNLHLLWPLHCWWILYHWATREAPAKPMTLLKRIQSEKENDVHNVHLRFQSVFPCATVAMSQMLRKAMQECAWKCFLVLFKYWCKFKYD